MFQLDGKVWERRMQLKRSSILVLANGPECLRSSFFVRSGPEDLSFFKSLMLFTSSCMSIGLVRFLLSCRVISDGEQPIFAVGAVSYTHLTLPTKA